MRGDIAADSAIRRVLAAIDDPAIAYEPGAGGRNPVPLDIGDLDVRVSIEGRRQARSHAGADRALLVGYADDLGMARRAQAEFIAAIDLARQHGSAADAMEAVYLPSSAVSGLH